MIFERFAACALDRAARAASRAAGRVFEADGGHEIPAGRPAGPL
jgi:hypothetical protein